MSLLRSTTAMKPSPDGKDFYVGSDRCQTSPDMAQSPTGREADYSVRAKEIVKVLDFIQFGGPDLTVGSTTFEMWMGL